MKLIFYVVGSVILCGFWSGNIFAQNINQMIQAKQERDARIERDGDGLTTAELYQMALSVDYHWPSAIIALGWLNTPEAADALVKLIHQAERMVAFNAAEGLADMSFEATLPVQIAALRATSLRPVDKMGLLFAIGENGGNALAEEAVISQLNDPAVNRVALQVLGMDLSPLFNLRLGSEGLYIPHKNKPVPISFH
ncbi:MAG: HEAT repeat domain-containing protein [Verrucomicrobiota bacterium]|jgi:hypothetical protein|nr:HEAT repeat domain-containing protein [Verrucomicrobiota bacterium]